MSKKILLTSFDTWLPHHKSNSSDDLLIEIAKLNFLPHSLTFLRQLPVDVEQAKLRALSKIDEMQPDAIICCGMAESRSRLSVESNATCGNTVLKTGVDLQELIADSTEIEISHDAGKFVCEGLYYEVLKYLGERRLNSRCIFVHVPLLNQANLAQIVAYFGIIIKNMTQV